MVKNTGGNKCKRGAQKHMSGTHSRQFVEKNPAETCEMYAAVVKLYGGSNCEVVCEDGITRMCIIRNKFRGRGKRDNFLTPGIWVLVGIRDWEVKHNGKNPNCDLLYVYSEDDKHKLKANASGNWTALILSTPDGQHDAPQEDYIVFEETKEAPDDALMKQLQEQYHNEKDGEDKRANDIIDIDDI